MGTSTIVGVVAGLLAAGAAAIANPPARRVATLTAPLAVPHPTYATIVQEIAVNRPAAVTWVRIGKYCDIAEWLDVPCTISSGREGQLGEVRELTAGVTEVLVGRTDLSYTYAQPVRLGRSYNMYHGTLEVRPVTATASRIVYSLFFDNSMLADDTAREQDRAQRAARFMAALRKMKGLAEGAANADQGPPQR